MTCSSVIEFVNVQTCGKAISCKAGSKMLFIVYCDNKILVECS